MRRTWPNNRLQYRTSCYFHDILHRCKIDRHVSCYQKSISVELLCKLLLQVESEASCTDPVQQIYCQDLSKQTEISLIVFFFFSIVLFVYLHGIAIANGTMANSRIAVRIFWRLGNECCRQGGKRASLCLAKWTDNK